MDDAAAVKAQELLKVHVRFLRFCLNVLPSKYEAQVSLGRVCRALALRHRPGRRSTD